MTQKSRCALFLLFYFTIIPAALTISNDRLTISAPLESAYATFDGKIPPQMEIKGWVCGTAGSKIHLKTVDYVYRLKLAEEGFKAAAAAVQTQYDTRKKMTVPPAIFEGFTTDEVKTFVDAVFQRFTVNASTMNTRLDGLQKELIPAIKGDPENFFGVSVKARVLAENHLDDNFHIETWQDDGAYQVWTTMDCYSASELSSMQHAIEQSLTAALAARDKLLKIATLVHNNRGTPYGIR